MVGTCSFPVNDEAHEAGQRSQGTCAPSPLLPHPGKPNCAYILLEHSIQLIPAEYTIPQGGYKAPLVKASPGKYPGSRQLACYVRTLRRFDRRLRRFDWGAFWKAPGLFAKSLF